MTPSKMYRGCRLFVPNILFRFEAHEHRVWILLPQTTEVIIGLRLLDGHTPWQLEFLAHIDEDTGQLSCTQPSVHTTHLRQLEDHQTWRSRPVSPS